MNTKEKALPGIYHWFIHSTNYFIRMSSECFQCTVRAVHMTFHILLHKRKQGRQQFYLFLAKFDDAWFLYFVQLFNFSPHSLVPLSLSVLHLVNNMKVLSCYKLNMYNFSTAFYLGFICHMQFIICILVLQINTFLETYG